MSCSFCFLFVDDMTNTANNTPHFSRPPTFMEGKQQMVNNITGVYYICGDSKVYVSTSFDLYAHDANALFDAILMTLLQQKQLPPVMFLQLDNVNTNKNVYVFAFAAILVKSGLFEEVYINFMIVHHTHDIIDQFFGCIGRQLKIEDYMTPQEIFDMIRECYTTPSGHKPEVFPTTYMYNYMAWLKHTVRPLKKHSKAHCFLIAKQGDEV